MSEFEELSKERKQLQLEGKLPEWFTTMSWQAFKGKYLFEADTYEEQIDRIVNNVGRFLDHKQEYFKSRWKEMLMKNHAYLATPVLANNGTKRGLSVSCSGSVIEDSIYGFCDSRTEASILSQEGFGTSAYVGDIRHRGSSISRGGTADGVLPVFKDMVLMADNISQGSTRRGAWAGYLPLDHEDFWEIALEVKNNPDGSNVGWNVSDDVIKKLNCGDEELTKRFQEALYVKMVTGKGYFNFVDKVARAQPEMYRRLGLSNKAQGLCVAPETAILTDGGTKTISSLSGMQVSMWCGYDYREVTVFKTGLKQKLITVMTSDGSSIDCTPYHRFRVYIRGELSTVSAENLKVGQVLPAFYTDDSTEIAKSIHVISITDNGRIDDTYCFNEPLDHIGVLNGILTMNCNEITLHADKDTSYTCVLSGMVLTTYDEWKDTDAVFCMTVFLDCMVSDFLESARNIKGLEKVVRGTEKSRAIGLGATGYHSAIQQRGLPWASMGAHLFNMEVFNHLHDESLKAARYLAETYGEPEWCTGTGLRNTHRTALAPNVSSSLIFGGESQGITPWYGNVYNEGTASGGMFRVNPEFIKILNTHGMYNDEILHKVLDDKGSVRNLDFLSDEEKELLLTAFELNQLEVINTASRRQPKICQGQSVNLFFDADEDEAYIAYVHQYAMEDPNLKGLYYIRSKAGVDASKGGCSSCAS